MKNPLTDTQIQIVFGQEMCAMKGCNKLKNFEPHSFSHSFDFWIHTVHYSKLVGRARKRLRKEENKKDIRKYRKKRNQIVKN